MDYQVMPPLSAEDFAALKADIKARGVQVWVEYDEHGNILDGHHRVRAVEELRAEGHDVAPPGRHVRKNLSEPEKRAHARALNLARRHLDQAQKRALIADQLKDTPERSDRQIAAGLGVSQPTVSAARKAMEESGEVIKLITTTGKDGVTQPRAKPKPKSVYIAPEVVAKAETLSPEKAAIILNGGKPVIASLHTGDEESYTPNERSPMLVPNVGRGSGR